MSSSLIPLSGLTLLHQACSLDHLLASLQQEQSSSARAFLSMLAQQPDQDGPNDSQVRGPVPREEKSDRKEKVKSPASEPELSGLREIDGAICKNDFAREGKPAARADDNGVSGTQLLAEPQLELMMQQLLKRASICEVGTLKSLQLELATTRLSKIGLDLRLDKGQIHARFRVADLAGLGMLQAAAPDLKTALQEKGLDVGSLDFMLHSPATASDEQGARGHTPEARAVNATSRSPKQRRDSSPKIPAPRKVNTDYIA